MTPVGPIRYVCRCPVCSGLVLFLCPALESLMARRKSLLAQMHAARQKAQLERQRAAERERKEFAAEERRIAARLEKEAQQAERARQQAARVREQQRQQAEAQRAEQRRSVEERRLAAARRAAEAEFRTDRSTGRLPLSNGSCWTGTVCWPRRAAALRKPSTLMARRNSLPRCSRRWPPRPTRTACMARARRCTGPRPASC